MSSHHISEPHTFELGITSFRVVTCWIMPSWRLRMKINQVRFAPLPSAHANTRISKRSYNLVCAMDPLYFHPSARRPVSWDDSVVVLNTFGQMMGQYLMISHDRFQFINQITSTKTLQNLCIWNSFV